MRRLECCSTAKMSTRMAKMTRLTTRVETKADVDVPQAEPMFLSVLSLRHLVSSRETASIATAAAAGGVGCERECG